MPYEHAGAGQLLLHIDIKKLSAHHAPPATDVTGNRRDRRSMAPAEDFVFVAIDDHARVAFPADIHPNGNARYPAQVAVSPGRCNITTRLGVTIKRLLTDNEARPFRC